VNTNNVGRVLVSLVVVIGFMTVTFMFLTEKAAGGTPGETLTLLVGALASNFTSVVSYWIGSSSGSTAKDEQLSKTADRLADKVPSLGSSGAAKPVRWTNLSEAEKAAIAAAGATDTRVAKFTVDAQNGGSTFDELDYLVAKNLLTADRAGEIKKAGVA
jgi:hypothetical protein